MTTAGSALIKPAIRAHGSKKISAGACEKHSDKKRALVRVDFKDWKGGEHVASFDAWLTPGLEKEELELLVPETLDQNTFTRATVTEIKYAYYDEDTEDHPTVSLGLE